MKTKISKEELFREIMSHSLKKFILRKANSVIFEYLDYEKKKIKFYIEIIKELNILFVLKTETIYFYFFGTDLYLTRKKKLYEKLLKDLNKLEKYKEDKKNFFINIIKIKGKFLEIPKCCIQSYIDDLAEIKIKRFLFKCANEGVYSYKRYKKQLKDLKIKDPFDIEMNKKEILYDLFIPCSPTCKKALKRLRDYEKLRRY